MNELFDTYDATITQLLAGLEADLASPRPLADTRWHQAITEIRQNMIHIRSLRAEELDAALTQQRGRLTRLGQLYLNLTRAPPP